MIRWLLGVAVPAALALAGCANPSPQEGPNVTRGIAAVTRGVQAYLTSSGTSERALALQSAAMDGRPIDVASFDTSLSRGSVRARINALVLLNAYVTKLAALADDDEPTEVLETAKTLEPQIAGLPQALSALTGDPTAASYVAPVGALLAWVGLPYTEAQRGQGITEALSTATPAALTLLDLLTADVKTVQSHREAETAALLERERRTYNANLRQLSIADRQAMAAAMQAASQAHAAAGNPAPMQLIDRLRGVHEALLTFVRSPRGRDDQAALEQALENFEIGVEPVGAGLSR